MHSQLLLAHVRHPTVGTSMRRRRSLCSKGQAGSKRQDGIHQTCARSAGTPEPAPIGIASVCFRTNGTQTTSSTHPPDQPQSVSQARAPLPQQPRAKQDVQALQEDVQRKVQDQCRAEGTHPRRSPKLPAAGVSLAKTLVVLKVAHLRKGAVDLTRSSSRAII